jgi:hypothetical protein
MRTHFGKHMTKETQLRIDTVTAKVDLKFDREVWVLKKIDEQRLEAAQMKFLSAYVCYCSRCSVVVFSTT